MIIMENLFLRLLTVRTDALEMAEECLRLASASIRLGS